MSNYHNNSEQAGEALSLPHIRVVENDAALDLIHAAFGLKPESVAVSSQVATEA